MIVTAPVLAFEPAAMVRVVLLLNVTGAVLGTETSTVTAALDSPDSVAVTVLALPFPRFSLIVPGVNTSVTVACPRRP